VIDNDAGCAIFELTETPDRINDFIGLMRDFGLVEVGRTGIVGMTRGAEVA
jgi:acetolactate synthase-1/3 small subunit